MEESKEILSEVAEMVQEEPVVQPKPKEKKVVQKPKDSYRVVLTCKKYTIAQDKRGNNIQIDGNLNVKVGDYIDI